MAAETVGGQDGLLHPHRPTVGGAFSLLALINPAAPAPQSLLRRLLGLPRDAELTAERIGASFRQQVAAQGPAITEEAERLAELRWAREELLKHLPPRTPTAGVTASGTPSQMKPPMRNDAWLHASFWDASRCFRCGAAITPEQPVQQGTEQVSYRYTTGAWEGHIGYLDIPCVVCLHCGRDDLLGPGRRGRCVRCGRTMHHATWHRRPGPKRVTCSEQCRREWRKTRRARQRPERACAVCGSTFSSRRADQVTCSAACRQKAYRQRKGVGILNLHDAGPGRA